MKKASELDPLAPRPSLDFSKGVRGKHFKRMQEGTNIVLIAPDLLDTFPDSEAVNDALRSLKKIAARSPEPDLAFATDAWIRRAILGDPSPWDPLELPWDGMPDTPGVPRDRSARPSLDTVLELRRDRMSTVRDFLAGLTSQPSLNALIE